MRHAVLIIWHRNIRNLIYLLDYFDSDFTVFIHIDRKARMGYDVLHALHEEYPNVRAWSKYKVRWGASSIVDAELFLMRQAMSSGNFDYIHLISGEDFPLKPIDEFKHFLKMRIMLNLYIAIHCHTPDGNMAACPVWNNGGLMVYLTLNQI